MSPPIFGLRVVSSMTSGCSILATEMAFCGRWVQHGEHWWRRHHQDSRFPLATRYQTEPPLLCGSAPRNRRTGVPTWCSKFEIALVCGSCGSEGEGGFQRYQVGVKKRPNGELTFKIGIVRFGAKLGRLLGVFWDRRWRQGEKARKREKWPKGRGTSSKGTARAPVGLANVSCRQGVADAA